MGNKVKSQRFTVNGDNTITDNISGILVVQDPTQLGEEFQKQMTFAEAEAAIAKLNENGFFGFKDWRLPTVEELCGMVDRTKCDPCYDTDIFKGKFDDWYWSSDLCAWNKGAAWCVLSDCGGVSYGLKGSHGYVRPVRSSQ